MIVTFYRKVFVFRIVKYQILGILFLVSQNSFQATEITAHKFGEYEECLKLDYQIPGSSRFTTPRSQVGAPDIVYYMSTPKDVVSYSIAILCGGSTSAGQVASIVHFHRYLLDEFLTLPAAVVTVEMWGIDGNEVDEKLFMEHYTRSQRLYDHQDIINHLLARPPKGWNGRLILFGVSEGGPLVLSLTQEYADYVDATVNWVGAGDQNWKEELWDFIKDLRKNMPWRYKFLDMLPSWIFNSGIPKKYELYRKAMQETLDNPTADQTFLDMTYKYHADALTYPKINYEQLRTPFLSVIGSRDPMIVSADLFAQKAFAAGVPITYMRIEGMNHSIRKRLDVVAQTFEWLKKLLEINGYSR